MHIFRPALERAAADDSRLHFAALDAAPTSDAALELLLEVTDRAQSREGRGVTDQLQRCIAAPRQLPNIKDRILYLGIARAARNPGLFDAVAEARRKMWLPVGAIFGHLEENANDRHEDILAAIEAGDAALASSTMEAHINDTRHTLEAWLKRR